MRTLSKFASIAFVALLALAAGNRANATAGGAQQALFAGKCPAVVSQFGHCRAPAMQAETSTLTAAFAVAPSNDRKTAINILIYNLKNAGLWSTKLEACYDGTAETSQQALLNWITPASFAGTGHGSFTQAPNIGWKFDGSTGFIDTGYNPSTNAVHLSQNSASLIVAAGTNVASSTQIDIGAQVAATGLFWLDSRDGSSRLFAPLNTANASGAVSPTSSVLTSVGISIASRTASNLTTFYKNGASIGSYDPTAFGTGIPNLSLYIGARHDNTGTTNFSSRIIKFACIGAGLTASDAANLSALLADYLNRASPLPPLVYVSNNTGNGQIVGSDTLGVGTFAAPFQTLDVALAAANPSQAVAMNCDASHSGVYTTAGTSINLTTAVSIIGTGATADCTVRATSPTLAVIQVSLVNGAVTLGPFTVDGQGAAPEGVRYNGSTIPYTVVHTGVKVINVTTDGFRDVNRATTVYNGGGCTFTTVIDGCYYAGGKLAGSISFNNFTCTLSGTTGPGTGCILVEAVTGAIGVSASATNSTFSITYDAAASAGRYGGLVINNINGAIVTDNSVTFSGHVAGTVGLPINVAPTLDSNAMESGNYYIAHNTIFNPSVNGYGILVGQEGTCAVPPHNGIVEFNNISSDATGAAGLIHGILTGCGINQIVRYNQGHTLGFLVGDKYGTGALFYGNIGWDLYTYGLVVKASVNSVFKHNTVVTAHATPSAMFEAEVDNAVMPNVPSTGVQFIDNIAATSGLCGPFVGVDTLSDATFSGNDYYCDTGSPGATAWSYQGNNFSTFAAWAAAHETTAFNVNPDFVNLATPAAASDLALAGPGVNALVPFDPLVPLDFAGVAFKTPLSAIGARECTAVGC